MLIRQLSRQYYSTSWITSNSSKRIYPCLNNFYHYKNNILFSTQQQHQSTTPTITDNKNDNKNEDKPEESDDAKNTSFKRRWSMYITGAIMATFIYKVCKSPSQYTTLPSDISDQPLTIRSYLFSNILANRALSRICAPLTEKTIPIKWRKHIYKSVGLFWTVEWNEFKPNLEYYTTFKQFFIRPLEYERNLSQSDLISPCDGTILTFGEINGDINNGILQQIKGVTFKLKQFLYGYDKLNINTNLNSKNKLYYTIIYLAPGDYHRFHACADNIKIDCINHIVGDLYPVKPSWLKKIPGLFTLNERIVMSGKWKNDLFFAYVPVGAFNVGSINLNCDNILKTNKKKHDADVWYKNNGENRNKKNDLNMEYTVYKQITEQTPFMKKYIQNLSNGHEIVYNKGDEIGYFAFGSTVVLIFEAPNFRFDVENVKQHKKIKYGDSLGDIIQ